MFGFGALFSVLGLAGLAYALGWRPQSGQQERGDTTQSALDILKVRYARGEIDKVEYDEIRDDLAEGR